MATRLIVDAEFSAEDVAEDLDAYLDEEFALDRPIAEGEVTIAKWAEGDPVQAMSIADRYAEKRRNALLKQRLVRGVYEAKKAVLDAWLAEYEDKIGQEVDRIDNLLNGYQRDFHPGEKTTKLPNAELCRRKNRDSIEWDENEALHYQERHYPDDVTRKLAKAALKQRLVKRDGEWFDAETGEMVDFVREVPPEKPESFSVKQDVEVPGNGD
jgi:hypothetical protein